jgi:hypothetical protein
MSDASYSITTPTRRLLFIGTGGILDDLERTVQLRDRQLPPTALEGLTTVVLDLGGMTPTPGPLRELVVTLGQRMKGGVYGEMKLIVATGDPAVAEMVDLLAGAYGLSLYLAKSSEEEDVRNAKPAGDLTETERQTLAGLSELGGRATVASFAGHAGIEHTAVNNRFSNLERKGYIHRQKRARRSGDVYFDPRQGPEDRLATPTREVLREHGVVADPYDRSPLQLEGEAAERAAEILKNRRSNKS